MLGARLGELRQRLDGLRAGTPHVSSMLARTLAFFARADGLKPLSAVEALDRALDQVGIHTAPDARLLRQASASKGKVGTLARGLERRAEAALAEFSDRLRGAELAAASGAPVPGASSALEDAFPKVARIVKVADIFAGPAEQVPFELFTPRRGVHRLPQSSRVAIAAFWAERARANTDDLIQKRRDLDAAHELLLQIGSEADRDLTRALRVEVADARERVKSLPAVRSLPDLTRHVRLEARRNPHTAYRSLRGLYERAIEAGDAQLAAAARDSLLPFLSPGALADAFETEAATAAAPPLAAQPATAEDRADAALAAVAFDLTAEQHSVFELAQGCARYFDVDDWLSEEFVEAELDVKRALPHRVPYPTQTLTFELASGLAEFRDFVITDPRTLVYDLASNRQQVRAYLESTPPRAKGRRRRTSVRVYVCDASGSMFGPRARFRDAIMIAELNNLRQKALRGDPIDPLYFCYFNDTPTEIFRVDTAAEATRQIRRLFDDSPADGQTDIGLALMAAFDSIRAAQGRDPYLARATVVLVTDGEDRIDVDFLRQMRAPMGSLDISMSFISLGWENRDLKSLVDEQREHGGRAFYVHLSDEEIAGARTEFDSRWRTVLPDDVPVTEVALDELAPRLEALEALASGRPMPAP
ncbi:MAG TPA: VWA domain-containing protein, partial [Myxococcaceae bacterium]|nr:VWA domain-containing protein [Myxococcaceae bacterium]